MPRSRIIITVIILSLVSATALAEEAGDVTLGLDESLRLIQARYLDERQTGVAGIAALGDQEQIQAAERLVPLLQDSNWQTQLHAARALQAIGAEAEQQIPALIANMDRALERRDTGLFELLGQTVADIRGLALQAQRRRGSKPGARRLLDLMRTVRMDADDAERFAPLGSLLESAEQSELNQSAQIFDLMNTAMGKDDTEQFDTLLAIVTGDGGAKAVPTLMELVATSSGDMQRQAISVLGRIGKDAGDALDTLLEIGRAADPDMQRHIQSTIAQIKTDNQAPQVTAVTASCQEGASVSIDLSITDADDLPVVLTAEIINQPEHGSAEVTDSHSIVYQADMGYTGTATVSWRASDGQDHSAPATITIEIEGDTTAPEVVSVTSAGEQALQVSFDKAVTVESAESASAYQLDQGARVTGASLSDDGTSVTLKTAGLNVDAEYTLRIRGVTDRSAAGNVIDDATTFTYHDVMPGLAYQYYEAGRREITAAHADDTFDQLIPQKSGSTDTIAIDIRERETDIGIVFSGFITISEAGEYTFYTNSDDGSFLFIGDELVVDNGGLHGMQERSGTIELDAGRHPFRVTWFQAGGGLGLRTHWRGPGIDKEDIPARVLSHAPDMAVTP